MTMIMPERGHDDGQVAPEEVHDEQEESDARRPHLQHHHHHHYHRRRHHYHHLNLFILATEFI